MVNTGSAPIRTVKDTGVGHRNCNAFPLKPSNGNTAFDGDAMKLIAKIYLLSTKDTFEAFQPELSHNFYLSIDLTIGYDDEVGGHNYQLYVCTPTWLDHNIQNTGSYPGRHTLIVNHYDHKEIQKYIDDILVKSVRPNREETFVVLSRHFFWEFEDYQQ